MSDIVLFIDDLRSTSSISICRICHEEEFESCKSLESPCSCSGTAKFAHRDCIQRWCDEKGNTICEICLQKFEPGYTSLLKKPHLIDTTITIRESLEAPRNEVEEEEDDDEEIGESTAADRSASRFKFVILILTAMLLIRHLFAVLIYGAADGYPFSLLTVLIVKASGIILPMILLLRIIAAIHNSSRHHYSNPGANVANSDDEEDGDGEQLNNDAIQRP